MTVVNSKNKSNPFYSDYKLHINTDNQISIFDKVVRTNNNESSYNESMIDWKPNGDNLNLVYKNYQTNEMFLKQNISFKFFVVKEALDMFNWTIHEKTKEFFGYTCQKATTTFRGRDYETWFSTEIPIGGPWKFDGLPGLILSIYSIDGYIIYEATQLVIENKVSDFFHNENPFKKDKNVLSWDEFKILYKKKAIDDSKYKPESGENLTIITPIMGIERYIEEDDPDYTIDKKIKFN